MGRHAPEVDDDVAVAGGDLVALQGIALRDDKACRAEGG